MSEDREMDDAEMANSNSNSNDSGDSLAADRAPSHIAPRPRRFALPNLGDLVPFHPLEHQAARSRNPDLTIPTLVIPNTAQVYFDGKPTQEYTICGKSYMMERPDNERRAEMIRTTVGGRTLKYVLKVIQEPARARACGAGPRSQADRRPVDPPPVVQMYIYQVLDDKYEDDITSTYDATFMLYASLEVARPIAQGRMHTGPVLPVLTGVAVASTAYLDRPQKAGYFIFPDLSVRHEGWYRLKFSLFEAVKRASDADLDKPFTPTDPTSKEIAPHECMANRMEIQSAPFQVFSAKKFPGLGRSTDLSRIVAEQGCRVRIRRDIRQRKRADGKPDFNSGNLDEPTTPEPYHHPYAHERTLSRSSLDPRFGMPLRRPSVESSYTPSEVRASSQLPSPNTPTSSSQMGPPPTTNIPAMNPRPLYSYYPQAQLPLPPPAPPAHYQPALPLPNPASSMYDPVARQYRMPDPMATKRTRDPREYEQSMAMKQGFRPDMPPRPQWSGADASEYSATNPGGQIAAEGAAEDDAGSEEDLEGDYLYKRADGGTYLKLTRTAP